MKKYFLKPIIILAVLVVAFSATVAFACQYPGHGSMVISSSRLTATATTSGVIHSGEGTYKNRLTTNPSLITYQATNPVSKTTVKMQYKDSSNVKSVSSTKTVSTSMVIESGKNLWSATCTKSGTTKTGTATAK